MIKILPKINSEEQAQHLSKTQQLFSSSPEPKNKRAVIRNICIQWQMYSPQMYVERMHNESTIMLEKCTNSANILCWRSVVDQNYIFLETCDCTHSKIKDDETWKYVVFIIIL